MRSLALISTLAVLAAGCAKSPPRPPAGPEPTPPALVVLVVIDQWPSWGFEQRRDLYQHGLARLLREGVVLPRVAYPYTGTFTASGHATMGTGAPPSVHGMIANGWWRRKLGRERLAEADDTWPIEALPGREATAVDGASGRGLRVEGIADVLRVATGGRARSVVIGGKSRAACLIGGRKPDVAIWYEPKLAGFTTSAAYGSLPAWALEFDRANPVAPLLDDVWDVSASDRELLARRTGIPDDPPGEGAEYDLGITFPHRLASSSDPAKALRSTPLLDRLEIDLALAAIEGEHLGQDAQGDLLVVSLSSHDYAGHNWGQESWEIVAHERALDAELARLLDGLDAAVGPERYAVILTSDHGATPLIEHGKHPGARRISPGEVHDAAEAGAAEVLGAGDWIAAVSSGMVYLSDAASGRAPAEREQVLAAVSARVAQVAQVARVVRLDGMPAGCAGLDADALAARACASRVEGESGELLVVPTEGSLVTSYGSGTSHDAPSDDNRLVPVILRVPRVAAGAIAADPEPTMLSLAPTLAALLRVPPPAAAAAAPWVTPP